MMIAQASPEEIAARSLVPFIATKVLGYLWYLFVESFGSLVVALFWAFATDTTEATPAKRGFPLVVAIGQMGGIIFPYSIGGLPHRLGLTTDTLSMVCLGMLTLLIIPLVRYFLRLTPSTLLTSFHGKNEKQEESEQESGFLEGLKLMLKHRYLLGIFAANFIYEVIVTIFYFNFKIAAGTQYSGVASKKAGSLFNMLLTPLQVSFGAVAGRAHYLMLSGGLGFPLLGLWLVIAIFLGKSFRRAIDDKSHLLII